MKFSSIFALGSLVVSAIAGPIVASEANAVDVAKRDTDIQSVLLGLKATVLDQTAAIKVILQANPHPSGSQVTDVINQITPDIQTLIGAISSAANLVTSLVLPPSIDVGQIVGLAQDIVMILVGLVTSLIGLGLNSALAIAQQVLSAITALLGAISDAIGDQNPILSSVLALVSGLTNTVATLLQIGGLIGSILNP